MKKKLLKTIPLYIATLCTYVTIFSELRFDLIEIQGIFIRIIGNFSLFFAMGFSGLILSEKVGFMGLFINTKIRYGAKIKRIAIYGGVVGVLMGALNILALTHGVYTIYDSILKRIMSEELCSNLETHKGMNLICVANITSTCWLKP